MKATWSLALSFGVTLMTTASSSAAIGRADLATQPVPQIRIYDPENCPDEVSRPLVPVPDNQPDLRMIVREVVSELKTAGFIGSDAPRDGVARGGHRITNPVTPTRRDASVWTLGRVLDEYVRQAEDESKAPATWSDYRTLVKKLTPHLGETDVRDLTSEQLVTAFKSIDEWASERTWVKHGSNLATLLRAFAPRSLSNKSGTRRDPLFESLEAVPTLAIPSERWFESRDSDSKQIGGHHPSKLPVMTRDEWRAVFRALDGQQLGTFAKLLACYGTRVRELLEWQWDSKSIRVDIEAGMLFRKDRKVAKNKASAPIHRALIPELRALRRDGCDRLFEGNVNKLNAWFYPEWRAAFERAGVPLRNPHQCRGDAISLWSSRPGFEIYRWAMFNHSPTSVEDRNYLRAVDEKFRQWVDSFDLFDA